MTQHARSTKQQACILLADAHRLQQVGRRRRRFLVDAVLGRLRRVQRGGQLGFGAVAQALHRVLAVKDALKSKGEGNGGGDETRRKQGGNAPAPRKKKKKETGRTIGSTHDLISCMRA